MYFVDATMIRKVDQNGIISTLLGSNDLTAVRPLSCDSSMDVAQVGLSLSLFPLISHHCATPDSEPERLTRVLFVLEGEWEEEIQIPGLSAEGLKWTGQ